MSTQVTVRFPQKLIDKIDAVATEEDKNRTQIIITLLEEMLRIREFQANKSENENAHTAKELLKEKCTLNYIMEIRQAVGEILRYTYPYPKSRYSDDTNTPDATLSLIAQQVGEAVEQAGGNKSD